MNDLVVLRQGFEDSLNLLADNEMDFLKGGDNVVVCRKGYDSGRGRLDYDSIIL